MSLTAGLSSGSSANPYQTLANQHAAGLANIESNLLPGSGLTQQQQAPLLMAVAIAIADYNYWIAAITDTGNNWYTMNYFNPDISSNRTSLPFWLQASIRGALSGANKAITYGQIDPPKIIGVDIVSSLTSGLAVGTSKVLFKILPTVNVSNAGWFTTFFENLECADAGVAVAEAATAGTANPLTGAIAGGVVYAICVNTKDKSTPTTLPYPTIRD